MVKLNMLFLVNKDIDIDELKAKLYMNGSCWKYLCLINLLNFRKLDHESDKLEVRMNIADFRKIMEMFSVRYIL